MSREMQSQANLMFEKTMYEYLQELERIYLRDSNDFKFNSSFSVKEVHRVAMSKMKLIDRTARKHGLKGFDLYYFIEITGNA